jgi:hypothetical protein
MARYLYSKEKIVAVAPMMDWTSQIYLFDIIDIFVKRGLGRKFGTQERQLR